MTDIYYDDAVPVGSSTASWFDYTYAGTLSTSYLSIADADTFAEQFINNGAWTVATTLQKMACLVQATQDIDSRELLGSTKYYGQRRKAPRSLNLDNEYTISGLTETEAMCWDDIQRATVAQAIWLMRNKSGNLHSEAINQGIASSDRYVGPIRESFRYNKRSERLCPETLTILSPWLSTRKIYRS